MALFTKLPNGRYAPASIAQIAEAHAAYLGAAFVGENLSAPADAARYLQAKYAHREAEVFACVMLDTRHRVLELRELFQGTIDGATVYPREVVKAALAANANAVILVHNHPSGVSEPSEADRAITAKLSKALALIEVRVLDHIIVSRTGHVSMAERGLV